MKEKYMQKLNKLEFLARKNFYTIELLKGYCENFEGGKIDVGLILYVIETVFRTQRHLVNQIDFAVINYYHETNME